jgi:peptidase E
VGVASEDNAQFFSWISAMMKAAGAGKVRLAPIAGRSADTSRAVEILNSSDLIFVSGGDVELGMRILKEKNIIPVLEKVFHEGTLYFGASAGSIMLCKQWVRWRDPDDDSSAELFPCLGFAPIYCDTHAEEDDWEELKALLKIAPSGTAGYGIPSDAAIMIGPGNSIEYLGAPSVRFMKTQGSAIKIIE